MVDLELLVGFGSEMILFRKNDQFTSRGGIPTSSYIVRVATRLDMVQVLVGLQY